MKKIISLMAIAVTFSACANVNNGAPDFTKAAESTINGVVSIKSYATPRAQQQQFSPFGFDDPFFEYFFGGGGNRRQQQQRQQQAEPKEQQLGLGSGVILSSDGYLVTNNHVIRDAERLEITLNDNRTFDATVVGSDPATDLALLKIDATDLPVIPMGDSDKLKIGEWVLAVGNPFGFTSTVTAGIVSAKGRSLGYNRQGQMRVESYIQTDAAVNPGNSGGALVNIDGELVGINTAIYSQTGNYAGYSFAIPASIVSKVVADIKSYGTVQRAVLGIRFMELSPELIKEKKIKGVNDGIYVAEVLERSAGLDAGLEQGDIIVAINGQPTHNSAAMQEQMALLRPGDKVEITYLRDGKKHTSSATLRNTSGSTAVAKAGDFSQLGCAFTELKADELRRLSLQSGIKVAGLTDGKFRDAGIREGFVITEINNTRVRSAQDVEKIYNAVKSSSEEDKVLFITGVTPTGQKKYYAVDISD